MYHDRTAWRCAFFVGKKYDSKGSTYRKCCPWAQALYITCRCIIHGPPLSTMSWTLSLHVLITLNLKMLCYSFFKRKRLVLSCIWKFSDSLQGRTFNIFDWKRCFVCGSLYKCWLNCTRILVKTTISLKSVISFATAKCCCRWLWSASLKLSG
jgi:hypothetical protein